MSWLSVVTAGPDAVCGGDIPRASTVDDIVLAVNNPPVECLCMCACMHAQVCMCVRVRAFVYVFQKPRKYMHISDCGIRIMLYIILNSHNKITICTYCTQTSPINIIGVSPLFLHISQRLLETNTCKMCMG